MIVYVVETCLAAEGEDAKAEAWMLASLHATSAGATKTAASMERVYTAMKQSKLVRVRELRVQS